MRYNGGFVLKFSVAELLTKLKTNLEEHKTIFIEAQEGYKKAFETELKKKLSKLVEGDIPSPGSRLSIPHSYAKDYEDAIEMLTFTSDAEVTLDQSLFNAYVLDEWDWQTNFLTSNSSYSVSATRKMS